MWDKVPADQQNGIIMGYTITYKSHTENDNGSVQVNASVRQTELTNLKEYVNYNITVFASTVKGDGPASDPIVVRTDQDSKLPCLSNFFHGMPVAGHGKVCPGFLFLCRCKMTNLIDSLIHVTAGTNFERFCDSGKEYM